MCQTNQYWYCVTLIVSIHALSLSSKRAINNKISKINMLLYKEINRQCNSHKIIFVPSKIKSQAAQKRLISHFLILKKVTKKLL